MTVTAMPQSDAKSGKAGADTGEEAPRSKKKLILILLVLVLAIGGAAYWFVLKPSPGPQKPVAGSVVALDPIQINLAGEHYLRVGMALQLVAGVKEADGSKALDTLIDEFSGRQIGEVTDPNKRRALKKALEHKLDEEYEHEVMGVYFTEFVTQ